MSDTELTLRQVQETYGKLPTAKEFFYDWGGLNEALFLLINGLREPNYDAFMMFITQLGNKHFFLPYMVVIGLFAVVMLLAKKITKKGGVKQQFIMWIGAFLVMGASFAFAAQAMPWLKEYFSFPRPYMALENVMQIEPRSAVVGHYSFPSGHMVFFSLIVISLWPLLSHHMRLLAVALMVLLAWSRVSLGVHFPADTLWSVALALAIVLVFRTLIYTVLRKLLGLHCGGD